MEIGVSQDLTSALQPHFKPTQPKTLPLARVPLISTLPARVSSALSIMMLVLVFALVSGVSRRHGRAFAWNDDGEQGDICMCGHT